MNHANGEKRVMVAKNRNTDDDPPEPSEQCLHTSICLDS